MLMPLVLTLTLSRKVEMRYILTLLLCFGLVACGGSDKKPEPIEEEQPTEVTVSGVVATGLAVTDAEVIFEDQDGNVVATTATVTTTASGGFSAVFADTPPTPLLIRVITDSGELKSIIDDATQTQANVNPVTSYVAEQIIANDGLADLTTGDFSQQGQQVVEQAFGDGVQFDAFATETFVARTSADDETTQPSPADVMLDALADVSAETSIEAVLDQAIADVQPLLEEPVFQVEVAKVLAEVQTNEPISTIIAEDSEITSALAIVEVFTTVIEAKVTEIETQLEGQSLSTEQQDAVIDGVVDIATEALADSESVISETTLGEALDNSDSLFVDSLVEVVTNESLTGSSQEVLLQVVEDTTEEISTIVEQSDIDLLTENVTLPDDVISEIDVVIEDTVIVDTNSRWSEANWGELVWQ